VKTKAKTGSKIICTIMAACFLLLIANKSYYLHSHTDINGNVYTHAHPYNKSSDSPDQSHEHSFNFLVSSSNLESASLILYFLLITILLFSIFARIFSSWNFAIPHTPYSFSSSRAPPINSSIPQFLDGFETRRV
jgi:4-amino-4-deoxy-L-arabinose transferase-like glycosyltransferase